jgi:ubiquinone/menaquinone biosynthesis C-methylase UbiE
LDVGCGTGVVTRLAAAQVGPGGMVVGLDVNPGMLAVARSATPKGMTIEWHEASAESMQLPDEAFDVVLCQMSLQFVADRLRAVRAMRRVLAPGGRLVLNVPGPAAPMFEALERAMGRHIAPAAAHMLQQVFALHDVNELLRLLQSVGFQAVRVAAHTKDLSLPAPKDFLWQYVNGTPLHLAVAQADDGARAALERECVAAWQEFRAADGMDCQQRIVVATGRR